MTTAIVSSVIANKYLNGGNAWVVLSWVLGLKRLGLDVFFIEQIPQKNCVNAAGGVTDFESSVNLAYFKSIVEQFDLVGAAALICGEGAQTYGLSQAELCQVADAADLLINITGHLTLHPIKRRIRRKVYLDLDPGFTQFWQAIGNPGARLEGHDYYFTIGENIGTSACSIPTNGIQWHTTRQPVVMADWPVAKAARAQRFTTVASWRGPYGRVQYGAKSFGLKAHEFRKFIELPQRVGQTFEIALDIHPAEERDLSALHTHGWQLVDPKIAASDPMAFSRYVRYSDAEFSVAQGIYVETNSGWFSDRTVRYLASGKPALVQDTGFSCNYPTGDGLIAFHTLEEARAGAERIMRCYELHSQAARALARRYFDSDMVLGRFLEQVNVAP
jgi:hypothetical protein